VFETLQVYLGSLYVNDFNRYGRTYQWWLRRRPVSSQLDDVLPLKTRNATATCAAGLGDQSPHSSPDVVQRYKNAIARQTSTPAPRRVQLGSAQGAMSKILDQTLPRSCRTSGPTSPISSSSRGNTAILVFPLCVLFVFLVLAAQYESLTALAIVLIVPMCLLPAASGRALDHVTQHLHADWSWCSVAWPARTPS